MFGAFGLSFSSEGKKDARRRASAPRVSIVAAAAVVFFASCWVTSRAVPMRSSTVSGVNTGSGRVLVWVAARARTRLRRLEGEISDSGWCSRGIAELGRKRASVCVTIERVKCVLGRVSGLRTRFKYACTCLLTY